MTDPARFPILHVSDDEIPAWYDAGWSYLGPSERAGYSIIKWESGKAPVAPLGSVIDDEQAHLARAVASLEGRAA